MCMLQPTAQLSEKRIEDLVRLAGYKMLGRVQRTGRNPSAVLSARLARSDTMRCAPCLLLLATRRRSRACVLIVCTPIAQLLASVKMHNLCARNRLQHVSCYESSCRTLRPGDTQQRRNSARSVNAVRSRSPSASGGWITSTLLPASLGPGGDTIVAQCESGAPNSGPSLIP